MRSLVTQSWSVPKDGRLSIEFVVSGRIFCADRRSPGQQRE